MSPVTKCVGEFAHAGRSPMNWGLSLARVNNYCGPAKATKAWPVGLCTDVVNSIDRAAAL
jgi:hypothetical protein